MNPLIAETQRAVAGQLAFEQAARELSRAARRPEGPAPTGRTLNPLSSVGGPGQNGAVPRPTGRLVGRAAELSSLVDAIRNAQQGLPSAVIVGGDAGVGQDPAAR